MLADEVFAGAVEVLKRNVTPAGLKASSTYYRQVWARDSFISFLGSNMLGDAELTRCALTTVNTFAKTRSSLGQIPNFYNVESGRAEFGFSGSTDSSSWFIIGLASLYEATGESSLLREPLDAALAAYRWLRHQDANDSWLIDSPQGADWMDAAIQRTGKTLYNNALFVMATRCVERLCSAAGRVLEQPYRLDYDLLLQRFSDVLLPGEESPRRLSSYWPRLARQVVAERPLGLSQEYYLHYVSFARFDTHFDTLSNLLCLLAGLCERRTAASIAGAIGRRRLAEPHPVRVLDPPYASGEPGFDASFDSSQPVQHRSTQFAYHNGGVWPFVGGLYVCALASMGMPSRDALDALARANVARREGDDAGFNEWLHGTTGEPLGQSGQSWSAAMYIAAALCSGGRKLLPFLS